MRVSDVKLHVAKHLSSLFNVLNKRSNQEEPRGHTSKARLAEDSPFGLAVFLVSTQLSQSLMTVFKM